MKKRLDLFPPMKCDQGCGECCGPAPATENEYRRVLAVAKAKGIVPIRQGITCPFYQEGTCSIYEARPLACRIFGHLRAMPCSRGYNTNIPDDMGRRIVFKNGTPQRVLHEALIDAGIVTTIEEAVAPLGEGT